MSTLSSAKKRLLSPCLIGSQGCNMNNNNGPELAIGNRDADSTALSSDCSDRSINANEAENSSAEVNIRHFRNPSPPLEFLEPGNVGEGDTIRGTAISERWIIQTLMKLANVVHNIERNSKEDLVCELDGDLETSLCQLWDISVEKEVVAFLLTVPTLSIFTDALSCRTYPRLTEMVIGIAGNMACIAEACDVLSHNEDFCQSLVKSLDSHDPPTLAELFRLYLAFIQNESSQSAWLKLTESDQKFLPRLTFITSSSTNGLLLKAVGDFLDFTLEINDNFCLLWATKDLVSALLEAIQQIGYNDVKLVDTFYHILHSLSTSDNGKEIIVSLHETIIESISFYLQNTLEDDFIDVKARAIGFTSCLAIMQTLLTTDPYKTIKILEKGNAIRSLLKLLNQLFALNGNMSTHDTILEESISTSIEEILSFDEGITLFLCTINDSKEDYIIESLHCLMKLPSGKALIDCLRSAIHSQSRVQSLPDLKRLSNALNQFET